MHHWTPPTLQNSKTPTPQDPFFNIKEIYKN